MNPLNDELERFASQGDFEMSWKNAQAIADRPKNRAPVVAVALAAAAVVGFVTWTAVAPWFPSETPVDDVAAASAAPAPAVQDGAIRLPVGGAHLWTPATAVQSISIVNPDLVEIRSTEDAAGTLVLQGVRPGRTDVVVVHTDGRTEILTAIVAFDVPSAQSTRTHRLPVGGMAIVQARWTSLDVVNPDIVDVVESQGRIQITAVRPGHTDLVITEAGQRRVESFVVDFDEAMTSPGVLPQQLAVGQALLLPVERPIANVTVANPDLLRAKPLGGQLMLEGVRPGLTDLLVVHEDGTLEQHRVVVSFSE